MTTIIDGKKISKEILAEIQREITLLSFQPVFCDVLVGEDPVSMQYVKMKAKMAENIGIKFHQAFFPSGITTENLVREIETLNKIENMCGIIVQLPLPSSLDQQKVLDAVDPHLDVDCLSTKGSEKFYQGDFSLGFPTALACLALLDSTNLGLKDKKIAVLGQGKLVGKPVSKLISARNLNQTIITSGTIDKEKILKEADVIISGMGELHLEILIDRLIREFNVAVHIGKPQVSYRETISNASTEDFEYSQKNE